MASEQFSLCWDNFHKNMSSGMNSLLESEDLVDVTIAVEGRYLKAHKMVLSVCSPYFRELFKVTPCKHPIVFLKDVSYIAMSDLLQFMYQGEVQVSQENLTTFIKTAEALQIKGLTGDGNGSSECDNEPHEENKPAEPEVAKPSPARAKKPHQTPSAPAPKRPRLEQTTPTSVAKTELAVGAVTATSTPSNEQLIQFKMEPYDQGQSSVTIADDNPDENFTDDPLDETNADDTNEDYSMMEGGDEEPQAGTSTDGTAGEGQDSATVSLLMEKSKEKYEQAYLKFECWCQENGFYEISEKVLLAYFNQKALTQKSSTLWNLYSMLRCMIAMKKNINIRRYTNLLTFLKRKSKGYKAKKSRVFTRQEIETFLTTASDDTYLLMKIVLIIGVAGACSREELTYMLVDDITDQGDHIQIVVPSRKIKVEREFIVTDGTIKGYSLLEMFRKYVNLRSPKTKHQRFFVNYRNGQCTVQPVGINTIGSIPSKIASFLGLEYPSQYTGHALRRTSASLASSGGWKKVYLG